MNQDLQAQADYIKENFSEISVEPIAYDNLIIYVEAENILNFLAFVFYYMRLLT